MALVFFAAKKEHPVTQTRVLDIRGFFAALVDHPETYIVASAGLPSSLQRKNTLDLELAIAVFT
jgi:hypothetical protein